MSLANTHYSQVAGRLRDLIRDGRWQPGERLPPERGLCDQFELSRITIRQALRLLEDERLVERRHGSGTYISPHPTRRIPVKIDYTGSIRLHAPRLCREVLLHRRQPADQETANSLGITAGEEILYAERVDVVENQPVAWDRVYIPGPYAERLDEADLAHVDFLETWTKAGRFEIAFCRQDVEAVQAAADDHRRLAIPRGLPVLKSTELYCVTPEQPAGLFISYYHPGHICISSTFDWRTRRPANGRRVK